MQAVKQAAEAAKAWDPHKDPKIDVSITPTPIVALRPHRSKRTTMRGTLLTTCARVWWPDNAQGDPFRTLFVARISHDVTDKKLRREFEEFGPIKKVTMVTNTKTGAHSLGSLGEGGSGASRAHLWFGAAGQMWHGGGACRRVACAGKQRGYAFIEYEDKKDMKEAYKTADGRKLEGRRVLVDVERGRTVESWCAGALEPCSCAAPGGSCGVEEGTR